MDLEDGRCKSSLEMGFWIPVVIQSILGWILLGFPSLSVLPFLGSASLRGRCCDMGQNDTIGKIELKPSIVLSSDNTNCKNDIQLFHQLFDELSVYRAYH